MARSSSPAILLVDGYNVIGAWTSLKHTRDCVGLEAARWELIEALINYSAFQGYETQLIFDAQYQNTPSNCESITQNLAVYYTDFGQTADTYIEKACSLFRQNIRKFEQRLIVATSDRAQQLTVIGYGAEWMSAVQLAADVEAAAQGIRQKKKSAKPPTRQRLANSLDPAAKQRLEQLRLGLGHHKSR